MDSTQGHGTLSLCITEKWIRDRLNLQVDFLDGVRSLLLPGSYGEKITHLGRSLLAFTLLKHLDLSRNALESLQGLDHLKNLETLNLYYNNIATLKELFRLRHNSKLKELDLRLNPVTKNEPDYRLFIIHMLVNLRRLDDHSICSSERKAAIYHFDTDQAHNFEELIKPEDKEAKQRLKCIDSRRLLVESLASRPTILEDETDELLELIAKSDNLLTQTKKLRHAPGVLLCEEGGNVHSNSDTDSDSCKRMQFSDETTAHTDLKVIGNFTPAPVTYSDQSQLNNVDKLNVPNALKELLELMQGYVEGDRSSLQIDSTFRGKFDSWLQQHQSQKTKELQKLVETLQKKVQTKEIQLEQLQKELLQSKSEACVLGERLKLQESKLDELRQDKSKEELLQLLQQANKDMAALQQHMQSVQEENILLKRTVKQTPKDYDKLQTQISDLQLENHTLKVECTNAAERHRQDMTNAAQIQELATMLQETHQSLVATNNHLLQELEETKHRHSQDLLQMNLNYEHLKKTVYHLQHV